MQLKMEKKSPQQPLSSEELECGPEKPLKRTEDLEQQSGELNDETKPTDKNSDDDELEEGEVDETLEEGEIDEAIEDVKPDERREPVSVDGALVEESADGQSVGCRVPESDQNSGAVARADGLSSKKVRDAVNRRHAAVRALRHDHQGKSQIELDATLDADSEGGLHNVKKRRIDETEDGISDVENTRSSRKIKRRKTAAFSAATTAPNGGSSVPRSREDPKIHLTYPSEIFEVAESYTLRGGLIVIAREVATSMKFANSIYSPADPRELILWSDASWTRYRPGTEEIASTAVTYKEDPSSNTWSDLITLVRGPRDTAYELLGLLQALRLAVRQYKPTSKQEVVKIFTDYQSALYLIKRSDKCRQIRQQGAKEILVGIRKEATRLADLKLHVEIHWVKGHENVLGNERADALTGAARKAYASAGNLQAAPDRPQLCELRLCNTSHEFRLNVDRKEIQRVLDLHSRENAYKGEPVNGNAKDQDWFNQTILPQQELREDPESLTGAKSSSTRTVAVPECQPSPPRERHGREDSEG